MLPINKSNTENVKKLLELSFTKYAPKDSAYNKYKIAPNGFNGTTDFNLYHHLSHD